MKVEFTDSRGNKQTGELIARHTDYTEPMNEVRWSRNSKRTAMLKDNEIRPVLVDFVRVNGSSNVYSESEMREAFEAVQAENWKAWISAEIEAEDLCVTAAAIEFFAGSEMYLKSIGNNRFEIFAPGYYARVGA